MSVLNGREEEQSKMRKVLVHYHLFKNAGSSIDFILKTAFQDKWENYDPGDPPHLLSGDMLVEYLEKNEALEAISSHMLVPPVPVSNIEIYPILFIREPITRVMSAYLFEWKKQKGLEEPSGSLSEYIESKFASPRVSAIEEFQCIRIGNDDSSRVKPVNQLTDEQILNNAKKVLKDLPAFGLVDRFDESMEKFNTAYGSEFPELEFHNVERNTTQSTRLTVQERFEKMEGEIGKELFDELILRNQLDIKLYQYACGLFDA